MNQHSTPKDFSHKDLQNKVRELQKEFQLDFSVEKNLNFSPLEYLLKKILNPEEGIESIIENAKWSTHAAQTFRYFLANEDKIYWLIQELNSHKKNHDRFDYLIQDFKDKIKYSSRKLPVNTITNVYFKAIDTSIKSDLVTRWLNRDKIKILQSEITDLNLSKVTLEYKIKNGLRSVSAADNKLKEINSKITDKKKEIQNLYFPKEKVKNANSFAKQKPFLEIYASHVLKLLEEMILNTSWETTLFGGETFRKKTIRVLEISPIKHSAKGDQIDSFEKSKFQKTSVEEVYYLPKNINKILMTIKNRKDNTSFETLQKITDIVKGAVEHRSWFRKESTQKFYESFLKQDFVNSLRDQNLTAGYAKALNRQAIFSNKKIVDSNSNNPNQPNSPKNKP